jgi:putative endonuclease
LNNILQIFWRRFWTVKSEVKSAGKFDATAMSGADFGRWAEKRAEQFLLKKGFRILAKNFRTQRGELDLVAMDGEDLVFVEVKAVRNQDAQPERKVDAHKRKNLAFAARCFIAKRHLEDSPARFDIVTIKLDETGCEQIEHEPDAFQVE